jgi:hypothetical protein
MNKENRLTLLCFFNEGMSLVLVVTKPHCTGSSLYFVKKKSIFSAYDFLYLHRQLSQHSRLGNMNIKAIEAKKHLGQNFLVDKNIAIKIVELLGCAIGGQGVGNRSRYGSIDKTYGRKGIYH